MKHIDRSSITLLLMAFLLIFTGTAQAQETMTISGNVTSYNGVEPDLQVTLNRIVNDQITRIASTVTDSTGFYSFEVEPDSYLVNVTFEGNTYHNVVNPQNATADFDFSGTVHGWVTHADGQPISGVTVNLVSRFNTLCATARTDESGHYQFTQVNLAEHTVRAEYMSVEYSSETVSVSKSPAVVNITVYDSTTDDSNIRVVTDHIIIGQDMDGPWVQEYVQFVNMGNTTYYAPSGVYVGIGTPLKIKNLQTNIMDCCMVREDKRVWIDPMEPMLPGDTTDATISYHLDTDEKEYIFEKDVLYPSSYIMVFGDADSGIDLEGQNIATDTQILEGRNYEVLRYANPDRGDTIRFTISGYTLPGRNNLESKDWIIYLFLGVLIIGILAYPIIANRRNSSQTETKISAETQKHPDISQESEPNLDDMSREELEAEKLKIFENLRSLDYKLEDNLISEDEYDDFKSEYKARAVEILRRLKAMESDDNVIPGQQEKPTPGIDLSGTVKEIKPRIQEIDDVNILEDAIENERNNKNRKTLINALNKRIDELK